MGRPAAFFDLDGTLVTINGGRSWIQREHRLGRISHGQLMKGAWFLTLYYFGLVNIERALGAALGTVAGQREEELRRGRPPGSVKTSCSIARKGGSPSWRPRSLGHPLCC